MGFLSRISLSESLFKWSKFYGHVAHLKGITWAKATSLDKCIILVKRTALVRRTTWIGLLTLLIISISLQGCQETAKAKGGKSTEGLVSGQINSIAPRVNSESPQINSVVLQAASAVPLEKEIPLELKWLLAAYPDHLSHSEGEYLIWKDSTRMRYHGGEGQLNDSLRLESPMLTDIFWWDYRTDTLLVKADEDPGRLRPMEFFAKMYGETKAKVAENLTIIRWLPSSINLPLKVTRVNGVADSLQAISNELDQFPELRKYLDRPAGTFNYRKIAGTERLSAHSWGIAIDINVNYADYWRWSSEFKTDQPLRYRNQIPMQIVRIFEKHGFIWGGRWHHYDTMHFEFRPEFFVTGYKEFLKNVHPDR